MSDTRADVAIVGAALGGLVAGAILARRGWHVVIVDGADVVGARGGALATSDGFWPSFGHRDGHDVGDCQMPWHWGAEAAREADVEVKLKRIVNPLRIHRIPEGAVLEGNWGPEGFLAAAEEIFECPKDGLGELMTVIAKLAGTGADEVFRLVPARLGPWLASEVARSGVRRAILLMAKVIFHSHPEEASVGRFAQFLQAPKEGPFIPDDDEVGGMQGLMEPWARAIRARGGEIALGCEPVEIVVTDGHARGVVAVDRGNFVREIAAPVVISTHPIWETFDLVDERLFPPPFVAAARELREHRADLIGWTAALRRLPRIRATGAVETHAGWNRFLHGAERAYRGGYHIPSMTSRRAAPDGKHLLELMMVRWFRGGSTSGQSWTRARAELDEAIAYLHRFYADLDEATEWQRHRYVAAPQSTSWYWAPLHRHAVEAPGIDGLYFASSTIEAPASIVDIAAYAGLEAARRALARGGTK